MANPLHLRKDVCSITWKTVETLNLLTLALMTMTITILAFRSTLSASEEIRKYARLLIKPVKMMEIPSTPTRNHLLLLSDQELARHSVQQGTKCEEWKDEKKSSATVLYTQIINSQLVYTVHGTHFAEGSAAP